MYTVLSLKHILSYRESAHYQCIIIIIIMLMMMMMMMMMMMWTLKKSFKVSDALGKYFAECVSMCVPPKFVG